MAVVSVAQVAGLRYPSGMCMVSSGTVGAEAHDREVGEAGVEAGGLDHDVADAMQRVLGERDVAAARIAHRPAAVAAGERVQAGTVAEVNVLHEPGFLQRV